MPPVAWLDNRSSSAQTTAEFYAKTLGLGLADGPGFKMLTASSVPFAGVSQDAEGPAQWIPYFEVFDLEQADAKARQNGGTVVQPRTRGPAGESIIVKDPGGALFALWQRG